MNHIKRGYLILVFNMGVFVMSTAQLRITPLMGIGFSTIKHHPDSRYASVKTANFTEVNLLLGLDAEIVVHKQIYLSVQLLHSINRNFAYFRNELPSIPLKDFSFYSLRNSIEIVYYPAPNFFLSAGPSINYHYKISKNYLDDYSVPQGHAIEQGYNVSIGYLYRKFTLVVGFSDGINFKHYYPNRGITLVFQPIKSIYLALGYRIHLDGNFKKDEVKCPEF
jgi:hypothetical protein